jgi:hypothetical protein
MQHVLPAFVQHSDVNFCLKALCLVSCASLAVLLPLAVLLMKLQQAGQLLNALPFGWGCNNLACCNLGGASEQQPGKSQLCSGCNTA